MSGINQTYYPPTLHNLIERNTTNNNNMNRNNSNNNSDYLIEMGDYPSNIRNNPPLPPPSSSSDSTCFIKLWSNTYLNNLITRNDGPNILNYKSTLSLRFTLILILTFFVALITVTITEYFSYQFKYCNLHWVTVFIVFCCSLMIIFQAFILVTRLKKIHEWESYYDNLTSNELDATAENGAVRGEDLGEILPTYQKAREDPPAYGNPIKTSSRN